MDRYSSIIALLPKTSYRIKQNSGHSIFIIAFLSILILYISSHLIDLSRFHLGPYNRILNDQVGYVTAARNIITTGKLTNNIIYPSTLLQNTNKNYLYLPGHYYLTAAAYIILGYGIIQSFIPNLVSFVITSVCTFLIATRIFNPKVGFFAALFFIIFPINIIFAFTAMAEMTFVCASVMSFCLFIYLPERLKPFFGPFLLIIPLLFRETGILLIIPMALMFLKNKKYYRRIIFFLLISAFITILFFSSNVYTGRPSFLYANLFDNRYTTIYLDVIAQQAISPHLQDLPPAIFHKWKNNITVLLTQNHSFDMRSVYIIISIMVFSFLWGVFKHDLTLIIFQSLPCSTLLLILSLYTINDYRGIRHLLFTYPLVAISLGYFYCKIPYPRILKSHVSSLKFIRYAPILILTIVSVFLVHFMFGKYSSTDLSDDRYTQLLEKLDHDDRTMLVAPEWSLYYVLNHYSVMWSFPPANFETFELLASKYDIGTIITIKNGDYSYLRPGVIESFGFSYESTLSDNNEDYIVSKKGDK